MSRPNGYSFLASVLVAMVAGGGMMAWSQEPNSSKPKILEKSNLVAWCIVPFDASKRSPEQRAKMLQVLGIDRCAYDWRDEHVASFEEEILQYKRHGIEMFAFWGGHPRAFELFEKYEIKPQIWRIMADPGGETQALRVERAAEAMRELAEQTKRQGLPLGLYNHGGWSGEPGNMVAVCKRLRVMGFEHVGIVYNFHHGHDHIEKWAQHFSQMQPYLLCLNINGMNPGAQPKILGLGQGEHESAMMRVVVESGYDGPIGILDHRTELDAKESLEENLEGVKWLRKELGEPGSGGPRPRAAKSPRVEDSSQRLFPGKEAYRRPPLTVEVRATIQRADQYRILVASDTKQSAEHWEIFTMPRSGHLTAYLPGHQPDHVRSDVSVTDGKPHELAMIYEADRVRLLVDGEVVADQKVERIQGTSVPGGLGIGRLVEGYFAGGVQIDWVRISKGVREIVLTGQKTIAADQETIELWKFDRKEDDVSYSEQQKPPQPIPYDRVLAEQVAQAALVEGDPIQGAKVFAATKTACLSCHTIGAHGGKVGPELTMIGTKRNAAHLAESLLWPTREIEPEFMIWRVLTIEGRVVTGFEVRSNEEGIVLRDPATGKEQFIPADDVEDKQPSQSAMPEELAAVLSPQERIDVVRFLSDLGKSEEGVPVEIDMVLAHAHPHGATDFPYDHAPLQPEQWPNHNHPVNQHRLYDFYTKQAEHFRQSHHRPVLLSGYPGLDGGEPGHWGYQVEEDWADDRWNDTDLGTLQAGILHLKDRSIARAICVRLGENQELAVGFNPETLTYEAAWTGGFVKFSKVRHGFLSGLRIDGQLVPLPQQSPLDDEAEYRGFHRIGNRVVFAYLIGKTEIWDAPWVEDGKLVREVAPAEKHSLYGKLKTATPQWPEQIVTEILPGDGKPYAVDTIQLPLENPWRALMFCGGHDFLPDGSALVCTMSGDVWHVTGLDSPPEEPGRAVWRRFASGLHHPLGLVVAEDGIFVQCRDQLTRLHDISGNGEADFYECFNNSFKTSTAGHDFICGLQRDQEGNFYTASGNQGLVRISADGRRADVVATGFRNPDGLGIMPDGTLTVPCSEGEWTPASMICGVTPEMLQSAEQGQPPHFGYGGPRDGQVPELPLVYIPRGLDNSSGGQVYVESDRWGPLSGQMIHLSFGMGTHFLLLQNEVEGQRQGAIIPLPGDFRSGVHRGRFNPADGQLYVSGMDGWVSFTPDDGCFQRVRYTGDQVQLPSAFHLHENGVRVTFTQPIEPSITTDLASHFAQCWNYRYGAGYGSPEYSTNHRGVRGHDPLRITSAHVLEDGHTLFLEIPEIQPVSQLHLRLHVDSGDGVDMFLTVNRLDQPFKQFPGYQPVEKVVAAHPLEVDVAIGAKQIPNPWRKPIEGAREIRLEAGKNLTFATQQIEVSAGEPIQLTFANPDVVPHNWALVAPDALRTVGQLANRMISDPESAAKHYVPDSGDVLAYTDVVSPGEEFSVYFVAPEQPGRYPYLCTFPGHWMVMNGTMVVE